MAGIPLQGYPRPGEPLTRDILRYMFTYNPLNGRLIRQNGYVNNNGREAGTIVNGRRVIEIATKKYVASRLVWIYFHDDRPACDIDHIDRNPLNDRIENLRLATRSQNCANKARYASNTSGYKGVHFHRANHRWTASIRYAGKSKHLGYFSTPEQAHQAYVAATKSLNGEYACF